MSGSGDAKRGEPSADRPDRTVEEAPEELSRLFCGRGAPASRIALGKAARQQVPRARLAVCEVDDRDPIALLEASNAGRLPNLIPIRYGRMIASPFAFYRGAAALMAYDLAKMPRTDIIVQLAGDAHLANFGFFASPERRILFGPNDFDETLPGPFDWDIRRLAVSFVIAARDRGFKTRDQCAVVRRLCETFRERTAAFSTMDTLDVWYYQFGAEEMLAIADSVGERAKEQATIDKARARSPRAVMSHEIELIDGRPHIRDSQPLIYHVATRGSREAKRFDEDIRRFVAEFRTTLPDERRALLDRYELMDVAMRVVGVGSVGTRCYMALFMADGESPLFLQIKEARASVLERYLPASKYANHGQRVVTGQRLLQSASDIFLGWSKSRDMGVDFYVRQLRDMKVSFDFKTFDVEDLSEYAVSCGHALAHSMAKAGDPALIYGYIGRADAFDAAIESFALAYAERNEKDWSLLKSAVKAGRVQAVRE
jgi:uncharacterized protein (DUF2252 family)